MVTVHSLLPNAGSQGPSIPELPHLTNNPTGKFWTEHQDKDSKEWGSKRGLEGASKEGGTLPYSGGSSIGDWTSI